LKQWRVVHLASRCAVGVTGYYPADVDSLAACMPDVLALDVACFNYHRMVDESEALYQRLMEARW